jgi:hypothetical protein
VDRVVDHVAIRAEPVATRTESDGHHPVVDVQGEPPVQADLVLTAAPASLERRVGAGDPPGATGPARPASRSHPAYQTSPVANPKLYLSDRLLWGASSLHGCDRLIHRRDGDSLAFVPAGHQFHGQP